jgi:hypothetical protein
MHNVRLQRLPERLGGVQPEARQGRQHLCIMCVYSGCQKDWEGSTGGEASVQPEAGQADREGSALFQPEAGQAGERRQGINSLAASGRPHRLGLEEG